MKLVDTMLPKKSEKEKKKSMEINYPEEKYPYGLELTFNTDMVNKLPELKNLSAEDYVDISGVGCVTGVNVSERQGKDQKEYTIRIQIEKVGVAKKINKDVKEMNPKEYKEYRMNKY